MLMIPPWNLFNAMSASLPGEHSDEISAVGAHLPFCLDSEDNLVTLAEMAEQAGVTIAELVEALRWMANRDLLRWDGKRKMVVRALPETSGAPIPLSIISAVGQRPVKG